MKSNIQTNTYETQSSITETKGKSRLPWKISMHSVMLLFSAFCILPLCLVISISISNEADIAKFGYNLIPKGISFDAYYYILKKPETILRAYGVTIFTTAAGTILSLILTTMLSYPLIRKDYPYRKATSFLIFFTMLFNGGLVPWYILVNNYLHLGNTIFVLFIPYLITPFNVLLMKGFLSGLSDSLIESAKIDGASEFLIFYKIVIPLSKPALATVGLFNILSYWNDWWLSLLFIDSPKLYSLQYLLYSIMENIQVMRSMILNGTVGTYVAATEVPDLSVRMALCVLAAGPMLFVFPFFQKYLVKGLTIGSVKG